MAFWGFSQGLSWAIWLVVFAAVATAIKAFYNVFLHPLSGYPGPKLWAATDAPYTIRWVNGTLSSQITQLHKIYGDIVRVGPSRLSYAHPDAWNDIRGHRKAGTDENPKDPHFYSVSSKQNILGSPRDDHARFRRVLSHGFSAKVMQQQQPIINTYIDLLIRRFKEIASAAQESGVPAVADVVAYFNYTTFDVIGDLAFGEPFGCLEKQKLHPWVQVIFDSNIEFGIAVMILRHAPIVLKLAKALAPERMGKALAGQVAFARRKVDQRLSLQTSRPDYIDAMLAGEGDPSKAITHTEMVQNSRILVLAGSETTATALSATTFFLATHLDVQQRLAKEVRSSFKTEEEIDVYSVQKLEYMLAVLDESMRMFPPVPSPLPRVCQKGGDVICGRYVPGGTGLDIWQMAMFRSPRNFTKPDQFIPDRWLPGSPRFNEFAGDRQQAFQPFSAGPRNCIGRNLAYMEMRLIVARLVWNFDLSVDDKGKKWKENCIDYNLWLKGPLEVTLSRVSHQ